MGRLWRHEMARVIDAEKQAGTGAHGGGTFGQGMLEVKQGFVEQGVVVLGEVVHGLEGEGADNGALVGQPLAHGIKGLLTFRLGEL